MTSDTPASSRRESPPASGRTPIGRRWAELKAAGLLTPAGLAAAPTDKGYAPRPVIPDLPAYIARALQDESEGVAVLSGAGADVPASLRGLDSFGQTKGNA